MFIERFLQIAVCVTVILSASLLGMGQGDSFLPVTVCIFSVMALLVTDIYGFFSLHQVFQSVVTLAATLIAAGNIILRNTGMEWIVAVANLLVYIQIILLFRKKDVHTYWQLVLLSFLQVVVAAAFPQTVTFGVFLFIYLFLVLTTIFLLTAVKRHHRDTAGVSSGENGRKLFQEHEKKLFLRMDWPRRVFSVGLYSIFIGTLVFFLTPRVGNSYYHGIREMGNSVSGFSDKIQLGKLGELLQNRNELMRVKLFSFNEEDIPPNDLQRRNFSKFPKTPLAPDRIPPKLYLRGAVLNIYESKTWQMVPDEESYPDNPSFVAQRPRSFMEDPLDASSIHPPPAVMKPESLTAVEYVFEPFIADENSKNFLDIFAIYPFYASYTPKSPGNRQFHYDPRQKKFRWEWPRRVPRYTLLTPAIFPREQAHVIPCEAPVETWEYLQLPEKVTADGETVSMIPTVIAQAEAWRGMLDDSEWREMQDAPDTTYSFYDISQHFTRQLRDSGRFRYATRRTPGDSALDPIEDFVKNAPVGHCEYFASVLALMLRSQGIPARVVLGFLTEEYISAGKFYVVRHSDAHAWVEAWIPPEAVPEDILENSPWGESVWENGAWLRLDATPSALENAGPLAKVANSVGGLLDWMEVLWNTYVIKMDAPRQTEAVYDPIQKFFRNTWARFYHNPLTRELWLVFWRWVGKWEGILKLAVVGMLVSALILRFFGFSWRRFSFPIFFRKNSAAENRKKRLAAEYARREIMVDFYRRFERILEKKGIRRGASQTARELAKTAERYFPPEVVARIVDTYYAIRFGHRNPGEETLGEIKKLVEEMKS